MANEEHLAVLRQGVEAWNAWRGEYKDVIPDLAEEDLTEAKLAGVNFSKANLFLTTLCGADLTKADLTGARLQGARLRETILREAILPGADLRETTFVRTDLAGADLTGCHVHGIGSWDVNLEGARQADLIITGPDQVKVTVDNIEVAQFVYLLLNNAHIRTAINSVTSKGVLILGRFTPKRKEILDALRERLREHDYLPILFDFDVPDARDITETVSLLARMARFIVADLTEPNSIPKELEVIVPSLAVPVQPLLEGADQQPYAMFKDYWKYDWLLHIHHYEGLEGLLASMAEKVIAPAEAKVKALAERRQAFEAELTKTR